MLKIIQSNCRCVGCGRATHPTINFISILALALWVASAVGCALPPYVVSLDAILVQQGVNQQIRYGYRCTAGAHRGASNQYMENTAAALQAADLDNRYAFIEFDVQYTRDKRIVLYHDKNMLRLFGKWKAVGEATLAELADITAGEIAVYDGIIGMLNKKINIEIKSRGDDQEDQALVDEIVADIRNRKRVDDLLLSSISSDVIKYINEKYPKISTGQIFWLTSSTYLHLDRLTQGLFDDISASQADYLMLHVANLRNIDDLLRLKPVGKTIVFWDFGDTMYIVHKDISDRLWGDSGIKTLFQFLHYKTFQPFRRSGRIESLPVASLGESSR